MGLLFEKVRYARPDGDLDVTWSLPSGALIGLVGRDGCGAQDVLRLAAGLLRPESGRLERRGVRLAEASLNSADPHAVRRSIAEEIENSPAVLLIGPSLALVDRAGCMGLMAGLNRLRRAGTAVVLHTHALDLLERHADEVVAFDAGKIVDRGDPRSVLGRYREREFQRAVLALSGNDSRPASRRGDGRTRVESVRLVDAEGNDAALLKSAALVAVEVKLRAAKDVAETVVGIMIRSRVGVTVYGTNTELEGVTPGVLAAGERVTVRFAFACNLCPGEYTLTVASHEPDGAAHDWLEEALFFTVEDDRYTAGVANLRARVTVER